VEIAPDSFSILPPGDSEIQVQGSGHVVRVFSSTARDLLALADNAASFATPNTDVPEFSAWPDPVDGFRVRTYNLPEHVQAGNSMRIFRTCKLMVNMIVPRVGARDIHKLSPHAHQDFEQGSLALQGTFMHHLRYPWVPDMDNWMPDEHLEMASPSLVVIPPKVVHTSRNIGAGTGQLVDIFSPPRVDFSLRGMVRNADEYPMPPGLA
jgi:mannose-6-phosphate isomerase-like protein (cupin superfamily)